MDSTFKLMKGISFSTCTVEYVRLSVSEVSDQILRQQKGGAIEEGLWNASGRPRSNPHQLQAWIMGPKGRMQFKKRLWYAFTVYEYKVENYKVPNEKRQRSEKSIDLVLS